MLKKLLSISLLLSLVFTTVPVSYAQDAGLCQQQVARALDSVMGVPGQDDLHGYLKQMSDLTSTNTQTHLLVDQIEQMARDARLEVQGICNEVARFSDMNIYYVAAYDLAQCQGMTDSADLSSQLNIVNFCTTRSDQLIDALLDMIREYLLRQAVRTSMEPVVQRMQSLNSRLTVLITEYSRLVNNFFTFSFRLGDTIIGERD